MQTKERFKWGEFIRALLAITVPIALQNLLTTTGSMIDTMMIAPLGENTVGAVGLCAQFSSLMFSSFWGFVGGGCLFFSQYWGAKDDAGINRAYGTTMSCLLFVGLVFAGFSAFGPEMVMRLYTDKAAIQQIGVEYLRLIGLNYICTVLSVGVSALLRSTERVRIPLIAAVASVCTNLFLNWVLIYGHFGLPAMGVSGAALATGCAGVVNLLVLVILAKATAFPYLFQIRQHVAWNRAWISEYLRKCFPIICNEFLIGVGNMGINVVLGRQSEQAIAAIAVFRVLEGLVIGFFTGFSNAASILVGKSVGAGELRIAYERAKRLVYTCGFIILLVCLGLLAAHTPILTSMSLSGESFEIGTGLLGIYVVAAVIRMCNWTQNDTYRAAGDSTFGTVLEIAFMFALVLPAVWYTGMCSGAPFLVVFICCYIDEPVRFVLMQIHMFSGKWIKPVTEQGKAAKAAFMEELKAQRAKKMAIR